VEKAILSNHAKRNITGTTRTSEFYGGVNIMIKTKVIDIPKEFSRYPAGRFITDGPFSGEAFRENFLVPALKANDSVELHFDGAIGYSCGFLEEAFGGLVRVHHMNPETLREKFNFITKDPILEIEIFQYINEAGENQ
jgi:hypothetical protein